MVANMRQCSYYVQVKHSLWTVRSVTLKQMSISQLWQCQLRKTAVSVETEHLHSSTDLISDQVAYILVPDIMSCMQDQQARHSQKFVKTPAHKSHPVILKFSI